MGIEWERNCGWIGIVWIALELSADLSGVGLFIALAYNCCASVSPDTLLGANETGRSMPAGAKADEDTWTGVDRPGRSCVVVGG